LLRLTFHCEPCKKILKLIEFDRVVHRRGVFGMFLNDAQIALGDKFAVTEQRFEEIPYAINERIRWFLKMHGGRGATLDLVHALGLPASSCRGCWQSCWAQRRAWKRSRASESTHQRAARIFRGAGATTETTASFCQMKVDCCLYSENPDLPEVGSMMLAGPL
jgi:hypothetical protein